LIEERWLKGQQLPCSFLVFEKVRGGHVLIQTFSPNVKIKVPTK